MTGPAARAATLSLLAAPLVAACASRARVPEADHAPDLGLELRLDAGLPGAATPLAVELAFAFPGDDDGETSVEVSADWAGATSERPDLEDVRFTGEDGKSVSFVEVDPHRWKVEHAPGARLVVRARLPRNAESRRADAAGRDHYRPILEGGREPALFHAIGHHLLPVPDHLDWTEPRVIELSYPGFAEAGWSVVDSFGVGAGARRVRSSLGELKSALFLAGAIDIFQPESCDGLVVAVVRDGLDLDGGELASVTGDIIALERGVMGDVESAHYLVSAIPVGEPQEHGHSFGGTGLTRCFALFLQPNTSLALDGPVGLQIRDLLAHECFHAWCGIGIPLEQPEEVCYWFSEGFTTWAAREMLRRAGWLDDEAYAEDLSRTLAEYHTSAARNRSAAELGPTFWTDSAAQSQPYLRGDVVAMGLDHALRDASGGTDDLFAFLRDLLAEARANGTRFDAEGLIARIEARVSAHTGAERGREVAASVRRVVVHGDTAQLAPDTFAPDFELGERTVYAWDPGLDVDASIEAHRAIGVREDGPAARAGLVEGQELPGFSVWRGDAEREIELTVRDGEQESRLSFLPRGVEMHVPFVAPVGRP